MNVYPESGTDGYKIDHRRQYPKETREVDSYFTPRKSRVEGVDKVVVFGMQYYCISALVEMWDKEFFEKPFSEVGARFYRRIKNYTSKAAADAVGIDHIKALHELGYMPLRIKALPEGSRCPMRVPMYSITSTSKPFFWLVNYLETDMSSEVWGMATSATLAHEYHLMFEKWAIKTGVDPQSVWWQGHDFSSRGMYGRTAAAMSGAAHLLSFYGTDTIPAIDFLEQYYGADSDKEIVGKSVWATEHAVMCVGTGFYIKRDGLTWEHYGKAEFKVFKRLITELYPTGIVSIVSDTWDLWQVLLEYMVKLKDIIMARDGKLVIRPDSGDPVEIICGSIRNEDNDIHSSYLGSNSVPSSRGVVSILWDIFGGTINKKGYKELDSHVGCIYGDSITLSRGDQICERLAEKKFASNCWIAGIGSFTYQYVTRDTFGFAMKATHASVEINGIEEGIDIFKDPITDDGTKKSGRGLQMVKEIGHINESGKWIHETYELIDQVTREDEEKSALKIVFLDGELFNITTLSEIRNRLNTA